MHYRARWMRFKVRANGAADGRSGRVALAPRPCLSRKRRAAHSSLLISKTTLAGTYHAFKFTRYTQRYLAEMQFRFNHRYDLRAILS